MRSRETAPVPVTRAPVTTPYALAACSRGFHPWLKAGRVVRKGQKGITIVAPVMGGEGNAKVVTIRPAWVFDVTQTDERTQRAAQRIRTGRDFPRPVNPRQTATPSS